MSFIISFVLACTVILATFMLQLCDDSPKSNGSIICAISFFAILAALYFVDFKKKFSISKTICNILIVLAVVAQLGTLLHSRDDFLAFSIANVLSSLQTILFFQKKTLRKSYEILTISFIEVAVGCVFQRGGLFVSALPIYAILAFTSFSLLFMWSERKFYAERVVLKKSFSGNKNLAMITAEELNDVHKIKDGEQDVEYAVYHYAHKATYTDETRFFRRSSTLPVQFELEYFRRFTTSALGALLFAGVFFCFFPRMDQAGFGALKFEPVNWENTRGGRATKTGFKPSIELGDLGPAADSHAVVMTIHFQDALNPENKSPIDSQQPIYLRGIALANYDNHVWADVKTTAEHNDAKGLMEAIKRKSVADPQTVISERIVNNDQFHEEVQLTPNTDDRRLFSRNLPPQRLHANSGSYKAATISQRTNQLINASTFFRQPPVLLPMGEGINYLDLSDQDRTNKLRDYCQKQKESIQYDLRSQLINMKIELNHLDTPIVFSTYPFFTVKSSTSIGTNRSLGVQLNPDNKEFRQVNEFWFLTTCFQNGRQVELTPNQERTYLYLDQYLAIDQTKFPRLIELAQQWDADSDIPKDDFVSRARRLESRLRDFGEYSYNRTGVLRNPDIDPLEDFISEHKEGHCEYFAGALALALRAIGIPSRVVVGYACYPSKDGAQTIVRQSDAHSWVEAYIPLEKLPTSASSSASLYAGSSYLNETTNCLPKATQDWINDGAWLRLDATPSAQRDAERPNLLTVGIYNWSNFFQTFGNDFIMNFNGAKQMQNVYGPLINLWNLSVAGIKAIVSESKKFKKHFNGVGIFFRYCIENVKVCIKGEHAFGTVVRLILFLGGIIILTVIIWRLGRKTAAKLREKVILAKELKRQKQLGLGRDEVAISFYKQVETYLENRLQVRRNLSETPMEFIERCFLLEDSRHKSPQDGKPGDSRTKRLLSLKTNANVPLNQATDPPISQETRNLLRRFITRYYQAQFDNVRITQEESKTWQEAFRKLT